MFSGLPGGSSGAGPATWAGILVVAIIALVGYAALTTFLFSAVP